MKYEYGLTILTPSYNRASLLPKLYSSLNDQTIKEFQWLIIDDGSTDGTEDVIKGFVNEGYAIDYHKKPNGGKHTALNYSHQYIRGQAVCIVDSDDWLLPDAVEKILERKKEYFRFKNIKLLTFLKGKNPGDSICGGFPEKPEISNHIEFRVNGHRKGDCCEIIDTAVFKEFPFPEYPGERFLGEGYLWNNAGFKYDTVYIPEIIYICEYLEGGLTRSGRYLRLLCPLGGMDNSNSFLNNGEGRTVNSKTLRKEAMLFVCYGKFACLSRKDIISRCKRKDLAAKYYMLGWMLYVYWKIKYK